VYDLSVFDAIQIEGEYKLDRNQPDQKQSKQSKQSKQLSSDDSINGDLSGSVPSNSDQDDCPMYIDVAAEYGARYLQNGGATSRLESAIVGMGRGDKLRLEVFATPTGIFLSSSAKSEPPVTRLTRIKKSTIDLGEVLRLEGLIGNYGARELNLSSFYKKIINPPSSLGRAGFFSLAFLSGFGASLARFGDLRAAMLSACLTTFIAVLGTTLSSRFSAMEILFNFFGSVVVFMLAGVMAPFVFMPPESIAIGTLVLLVPGLTLTNAISELAEQNLVSGTAKMMKGILVLLAIGTAYLLAQDLVSIAGLSRSLPISGGTQERISVAPLFEFTGIVLLIISYCLMFNIPKRMLPLAVFTGVASWYTLYLMDGSSYFVLASFLPAFVAGLLSLIFARTLNTPSQIFSVPGILSLVPGLLALSAFESVATGSADRISEIAFQVATTGASITFGLFTARIPFVFLKKSQSEI